MREHYEIGTIEQLRAIADILRIRIIDMLEKQAMTVTELGKQLGLAPARVHYHVRELERVGLLELVETREKGGILEKYYQPIAHVISVSQALLTAPSNEAVAAMQELFEQISSGYLQAFRNLSAQPESLVDAGLSLGFSHLYLTVEEQKRLSDQFGELVRRFETPRGLKGERAITMAMLMYPTNLVEQKQQDEEVSAQIVPVRVLGALDYSRAELLQMRNEGKRLRINVIGLCHFADDIDASLIEETVESFKLMGKLLASPEVKASLKNKEAQV